MRKRSPSGSSADRRRTMRESVKERLRRIEADRETGQGLFYTPNLITPEYGAAWIDFGFMPEHTKKFYYFVALQTTAHAYSELLHDLAWERAEKEYPREDTGHLDDFLARLNDRSPEAQAVLSAKMTRINEIYAELVEAKDPLNMVKEQIELRTEEYSAPCIGVWATIDVPEIFPQTIIDFIQDFRKNVGDKNEQGIVWTGKMNIIPNINSIYRLSANALK